MRLINRNIEKDIKKALSVFPVTGIIGPRQVGKTTLAKKIISNIKKKSIYLDLELPSDLNKLHEPEIFFESLKDHCIVLDEIQRMPNLFPLLRSIIDKDRQNCRFILLGSASPTLLKHSSESLAGRITYFELMPFSLKEIANTKYEKQLWFKGGFPLALLSKSEEIWSSWMSSFIRTLIERDFALLGLTTSATAIRNMLLMIANYQGGILNASNFAKSLGVSVPTIIRFLDFLESAFLISRLYSYNKNIKKRLVKSPKLYIRDSGFLHNLLDIKSYHNLLGNIAIGNSFEGYAIEQIKNIKKQDINLYYYRTQDGSEIDLVLEKGNETVATVEIKFSNSPSVSKGYSIAVSDIGIKNNYIITPGSDEYFLRDNIKVCSIKTFIEKYLGKL